MGARAEIEAVINNDWKDKEVAKWVIDKLPLLEYGFTHPACPVYKLDLDLGLRLDNENKGYPNFRNTKKLVISGGFEGTEGHLKVVDEMHEARALTEDASGLVVLMLEPDSYIVGRKNRQPLINLEQRRQLWSTSGLADAVICLPNKPDDISTPDFYDQRIHKLISPATWCVNVENPHFFRILNRGIETPSYDLIRLFVHNIEIHTSFLNLTREFTKDEVREKLRNYLRGLIVSNRYTTKKLLSTEEELNLYWERIAKGL